ncbi:MAG: late competence development ComFB family protein [Thermoanaerobacteraceae bacterium]|nr:late competence development ComFB family protein [Thermoanaerobacteraceae bacterium]
MQLKNYMEEAVFDMLDDVMRDLGVCMCEKCRYDVAAIALNSLPPKYVVTDEGEIYSRTNELTAQFNADIAAVITRAAEIVSKNLRHEVRNG